MTARDRGPVVEVGQAWRDRDERELGRMVEVVGLEWIGGVRYVHVVTIASWRERAIGRRSSVQERMFARRFSFYRGAS